MSLTRLYQKQGKLNEMIQLLETKIVQCEDNYMLYGLLSYIYALQGEKQLARKFRLKAESIRGDGFSFRVQENYRAIIECALGYDCIFIAMQYPMRPVNMLRRMLAGYSNIVFVDNEELFKNAVDAYGYDAVFYDIFAGDFGHCRKLGMGILAKNLADIILKKMGANA